MYASVRRYEVSGAADEMRKRIESEFLPIVSKTPGFVAYYVVDDGKGSIVSISLFNDKEGADASTRAAADWVGRRLSEFIKGPASVVAGEVTVRS